MDIKVWGTHNTYISLLLHLHDYIFVFTSLYKTQTMKFLKGRNYVLFIIVSSHAQMLCVHIFTQKTFSHLERNSVVSKAF
jgi:hypothetical protein